MSVRCLIWSFEHGQWWQPNAAGYTNQLEEAGRYNLLRAIGYCENALRSNPLEHGEALLPLIEPVPPGVVLPLRTDPARWAVSITVVTTGIYVRAITSEGKWESVDIAFLDRESLHQWLRSSGGNNIIAENVVALLLGHR